MNNQPQLEDDAKEPVLPLIQHRLPWLFIGLIGGILATIFASYFENLLTANIELSYFIPVIVYMSSAVGSQTGTIYIRNLSREKVRFSDYFTKELLLGIFLGVVFGSLIGVFAYLWFSSLSTALAVGISMFMSITTAPIVSLIVPAILKREHTDPAVGTGPFTTVIQDLISLLIYFLIASTIIFGEINLL